MMFHKNKIIIIVDPQVDFTSTQGVFGTKEAEKVMDNIVYQLQNIKTSPDVGFILTRDSHIYNEYPISVEGQKLLAHCVYGTPGYEFDPKIKDFFGDDYKYCVNKNSFGCSELYRYIKNFFDADNSTLIELWGFCTNICVISNALMLRSTLPNNRIQIREKCCAGSTKEGHKAALAVARDNLIDIV